MKNQENPDQSAKSAQTKPADVAPPVVTSGGTQAQHQSSQSPAEEQEAARIESGTPTWLKKLLRWTSRKASKATITEWITALATVAIFFMGLAQWLTSRSQLKTMNHSLTSTDGQLTEMKTQNSLTRQQLIGTEAAVVEPTLDWSPISGFNTIQITWKNSGHVAASEIHAQLRVAKTSLPTETVIWKSDIIVSSLGNLVPGDNRTTTTSGLYQLIVY